jgi:ribosomal protein S18 acetylase RimI-like enzyme
VFTGGEPFLHPGRLAELVRTVSESGRSAAVVTNAAWALEPERAEELLSQARQSGLKGITVSVDEYHRPAVPLDAISRLLKRAQAAGLIVNVAGIGKKGREQIAQLEADGLALAHPRELNLFDLENIGIASSLGEDRVRNPDLSSCHAAMEPLISPDGSVYACCTYHLFNIRTPVLLRGNVLNQPVGEILEEASRDYLLAAVAALGPGGLLKLLGRPAPRKVVSPCSLCLSLLNDAAIVDELRARIGSDKQLRKELVGWHMVCQAETSKGRDSGSGSYFVLEPGDGRSAGLLRKSLEAGDGEAVFVGLGRSMEPVLLPGDRVKIAKVKGRLRAGWVVVFSWQGGIVTHRVIRVAEKVFWARGDSCADMEGPVPVEDVIGRVVAFNRDGRWHSLEGATGETLGLAVNIFNSSMRRTARRWPRLRQVIETDLLGIFKALGRWVYGDIRVSVEQETEQVIGALVSSGLSLSQKLVKEAEKLTKRGDLKLFVARSSRRGRVGWLLLYKTESADGVATGVLSSLLVSFGARGVGVYGRLLAAAEGAARKDGMRKLVALVAPGDVSSIREYQSAGFSLLTNDLQEGKTSLEKGL